MNSMFVLGRVVPGVEADERPVAEGRHLGVGGAPVRHVRVVERGFEDLVLEHQSLVVADRRVDLRQRLAQQVLPGPHVVLAGVVRAVREPDLEVARAGLAHHLDAPEVVVDRLATDRGVAVGEAAELVGLVLERVRVDRAELDPEVRRVPSQRAEVVDEVPWDVQRDLRREPREAVHLRGVGDLLERVAGHAGLREHAEAGAGVAERPRGQLDRLLRERVGDPVEGRHRSCIASLAPVRSSAR